MKSGFRIAALGSCIAAVSAAAGATVSNVGFLQDPSKGRATITYSIDEPAIITVDVRTNRGDGVYASIGADKRPELRDRIGFFRAREEGGDEPGHGRNGYGEKELLPEKERRLRDMRPDELEKHGAEERNGHRDNLRPRVYAHPEPPQKKDESRARADLHHQVETELRARNQRRERTSGDYQHHGCHARDEDHLALGRPPADEPLPHVVRHVVRPH